MDMSPSMTLRRYFTGLAEYTFAAQLGVVDPPLVDYLSDLLARFVRCDVIYRLRSLAGRPLREVADMLVEAQQRIGDARREAHRHIGDFTLFWTGVYPEAIKRLKGPYSKDQLLNYQQEGKRAYWIASTIRTEQHASAPSDVLGRLSQQFELCAYGLREVRRQWESDEDEPPVRPILIN